MLHTDIPSQSEIERLLGVRDPACVSIYVATSPLTQEAQAARIELKTLAGRATEQLDGADRRQVAAIADALDDLVDDDDFWAAQAHSLAVFAAPGLTLTFRLPNRLSSHVEVGDRFYVKPLLRAITFPQAAFVLALAAGSVRLVEVTREGPASTVAVPDLPTDVASAAGKSSIADRSPDTRLQGSEGQKVRLQQYARKVDQALRGVLTGLELPLILAATEPLASIYRSLNSYPHLVEAVIGGSADGVADAELAEAARPILDELYATELRSIGERFELASSQERASADIATVARAATYGAVAVLVVDIDAKVPGTVEEETGAVRFADEDDAASYGVVDETARRVLLSGGKVLAVRRDEVPGEGPVAAILRYPL